MDTFDAKRLLIKFLANEHAETPGWDRQVEHAMVVLTGGGNVVQGRKILAALAVAEGERRALITEKLLTLAGKD